MQDAKGAVESVNCNPMAEQPPTKLNYAG